MLEALSSMDCYVHFESFSVLAAVHTFSTERIIFDIYAHLNVSIV